MGGVRCLTASAALLLLAIPALAQDFVRAAQLGGTERDWAYGVTLDAGGKSYIVGEFEGTADFDPGPGTFTLTASAGATDGYVSLLDEAGNFVWARQLGGTTATRPQRVAVDAEGNVYIAGYFLGTTDFDPGPGTFELTDDGFSWDAFVCVLDREGNFVWARQFGKTGYTFARGLALSAGGNVYTVGSFSGTTDFDPGPDTFDLTSTEQGAFLSVLDSAGNFVWAGQWTSVSSAHVVELDAVGKVYVVGDFRLTVDFDPGPGTFNLTSASDKSDGFVVVLDSVFNFVWARRWGGAAADHARFVELDALGNVLTGGHFYDTADFDPGPGKFELASAGGADAYVSVLDSAGNFVRAQRWGGTGSDTLEDLALSNDGIMYAVGPFSDTVDFDPGPGEFALTSAGEFNAYVLMLDGGGDFIWAGRSGGTVRNMARAVAVDAKGNVFTVGDFQGSADFDPGPDTFSLSADLVDAFVWVLGSCGHFFDQSTYGALLFPPRCTLDASTLAGDVYASATAGVRNGADDTFYLSSEGMGFVPLVVDDAVHCDGQDTGLGPYGYQAGVPPFVYHAPIDHNLVPVPAHDITALLPAGTSQPLFELLDSDRSIYGNTAVYLVRDCGLWIDENKSGQTRLNWVSHDVEVAGLQSNLQVVSGMLSELRADGDFGRACDLGTFVDTTQAVDTRSAPPPGDGYYYLVSGTCAKPIGFGESSSGSRTGLPPASVCP